MTDREPKIEVIAHGPYEVTGTVPLPTQALETAQALKLSRVEVLSRRVLDRL
jgi:hypothetical protein